MDHVDEPTLSDGRGLSRRTVVRSAAHAAWMVPAISLVTAAPALAASGGTVTLSLPSAAFNGNSKNIKAKVTVTATGSGTVSVTLNITFDSALGAITLPATAPTGWTRVTPATGTAPAGSTIQYSRSIVGAAGGTVVTFDATPTANQFVATTHPAVDTSVSYGVVVTPAAWTAGGSVSTTLAH